jgi:exodeoxyribonuclease III
MKLLSWNVNGIRAVHNKNVFLPWIKNEKPDIFCLQETKAHKSQLSQEITNINGYEAFFAEADKKGYSGTAIYTKIQPTDIHLATIGIDDMDTEGRIVQATYKDFILVNVYTPNAKPQLERLEDRQRWDHLFLTYIKDLEKIKPVIVCGDFNVAHQEIDLARPDANHQSAGFTDEERAGMDNYVSAGLVDTFRHLHPDQLDAYTWWSYRGGARKRNVGWRIDYFLVTKILKSKIKRAEIQETVFGSDHCPVLLEINLK